MKINKKLILISAALLATAPAIGTFTAVNTPVVQAAAKQKGTIIVSADTGLYNSSGKMLTSYKGKPFITFGKTTTLKYYGNPVKIKRNYYYYIGNGAYAAADYLTKIDGHKALSLNHNSYVYTRSGKRTKKLLRKGLSYAFAGKYVKDDAATNYVFNRGKNKYQLKTVRIKGSDFFQIKKNQYIKVANIQSIESNQLDLAQMKVTIKKNTPILIVGANGYALENGKTAKKGQKFTVDAEVGMNVGANSSPKAYRIKGTDTYLWVKDAYSRQNVATFATDASDFKNYIVRPPKDNLQFFNSNGENITPAGFTYKRHQLLGVDGQMYIWVPKENKAELFYHIVATSKSFDTTERVNGYYRSQNVKIGNAFVKEAEVETYDGLKKPELINTAAEAKADAQKQAGASERNKLQTFVNNEDTIKSSTAYKLSKHSTKENYDASIQEAKTMLKSKRNLSSAEVKLMNWILQTRVKDLYGKKITVKNSAKLTKTEINQLTSLLNSLSFSSDNGKTYTGYSYNESVNKVERVVTSNGKVVSKTEVPVTDFVSEKQNTLKRSLSVVINSKRFFGYFLINVR